MSRFYNTSRSNPIDWAYRLPYEQMMQGVLSKQAMQDKAQLTIDEAQAAGQNIKFLPQDRALAMDQINWLNQNVDSLSNVDLTDPTNRAKLREFSKEVANRWGNQGIVGAIQNSVANRSAYLESLSGNKKLTPEMRYAAQAYFDSNYGGVNDSTPYLGNYNTYSGNMLSDFVNVNDEWLKLSREVENDEVTEGGSSLAGVYIKDWEQFRSATNPEKLAMVYQGFLQREDVQNYLREGINYGYINPSDWMSEELDLGKSKLPIINKSLFLAGLGQKGEKNKEISKLRNNSFANKQWESQNAIDKSVNPAVTLMKQAASDGSATYSGSVKGIFKDGKISAKEALVIPNVTPPEGVSPEEMYLMQLYAMSPASNDPSKMTNRGLINRLSTYDEDPYFTAANMYARDKDLSKKELHNRIKGIYDSLDDDAKKGYRELAALSFDSNEMLEANTGAGARVRNIAGNTYFDVKASNKNADSFGGISSKTLKRINKLFGQEVFTINPKDSKITADVSVQRNLNEIGMATMNQSVGVSHDANRVNELNQFADVQSRRALYNSQGTASGLIRYNDNYFTEEELKKGADLTDADIKALKSLQESKSNYNPVELFEPLLMENMKPQLDEMGIPIEYDIYGSPMAPNQPTQ